MSDSIVKTVTVPLCADRAFRLFTEEISEWWPVDTYSLSTKDEEIVKSVHIAPEVGGEVTETRTDGSTALWGHVTKWDPGKRFGMRWQIGHEADEATQVDVRFDVVADGTRVTLVHSGWQDLGRTAVALQAAELQTFVMKKGYDAGWQGLLGLRYRMACQRAMQPVTLAL